MHRLLVTFAAFAFTCVAIGSVPARAQQSAPDQYEGQSKPPADDAIVTQPEPQAKPPAGHTIPAPAQPLPTLQTRTQETVVAHPSSVDPSVNFPSPDDADNGIVQVAPDPVRPMTSAAQPRLSTRSEISDPDGDIVHPTLPPGVLAEGTMIRARLLSRLSTSQSEQGQMFRTRVASDVLQDGQVLIPAGAEIDGHVVEVSAGSFGGHGSMRLRPDSVILLDGSRYRLDAQVIGTPGNNTKVDREGTINPGSRVKKDGIEYGGTIGTGAATGAVLGGPVGALAGSIVGASVISVHLLMDHPQASLEPGTVLVFSLNRRLNLVPATASMPTATSATASADQDN